MVFCCWKRLQVEVINDKVFGIAIVVVTVNTQIQFNELLMVFLILQFCRISGSRIADIFINIGPLKKGAHSKKEKVLFHAMGLLSNVTRAILGFGLFFIP